MKFKKFRIGKVDIYEKQGYGKEQSEARGEINCIDSSNCYKLKRKLYLLLTCEIKLHSM